MDSRSNSNETDSGRQVGTCQARLTGHSPAVPLTPPGATAGSAPAPSVRTCTVQVLFPTLGVEIISFDGSASQAVERWLECCLRELREITRSNDDIMTTASLHYNSVGCYCLAAVVAEQRESNLRRQGSGSTARETPRGWLHNTETGVKTSVINSLLT